MCVGWEERQDLSVHGPKKGAPAGPKSAFWFKAFYVVLNCWFKPCHIWARCGPRGPDVFLTRCEWVCQWTGTKKSSPQRRKERRRKRRGQDWWQADVVMVFLPPFATILQPSTCPLHVQWNSDTLLKLWCSEFHPWRQILNWIKTDASTRWRFCRQFNFYWGHFYYAVASSK